MDIGASIRPSYIQPYHFGKELLFRSLFWYTIPFESIQLSDNKHKTTMRRHTYSEYRTINGKLLCMLAQPTIWSVFHLLNYSGKYQQGIPDGIDCLFIWRLYGARVRDIQLHSNDESRWSDAVERNIQDCRKPFGNNKMTKYPSLWMKRNSGETKRRDIEQETGDL